MDAARERNAVGTCGRLRVVAPQCGLSTNRDTTHAFITGTGLASRKSPSGSISWRPVFTPPQYHAGAEPGVSALFRSPAPKVRLHPVFPVI